MKMMLSHSPQVRWEMQQMMSVMMMTTIMKMMLSHSPQVEVRS